MCAARCTAALRASGRRRPRRSRRRPARSSCTAERSRRRTTSRRRAARRRAPSTSSASTSRTSSRDRIRGTRHRRTTAGALSFSARERLQSKLGVDGRVVDATATPTPSGRLRSLVVQTTNGPETVPASLVRTALGLRSTWITVGVLRLDKPSTGVVAFGSAARLGGVVRGLGTPRLASSPDGAAWSGAAEVTLRQDRRRHRGRQADADHAVPAGGRGRLVAGRARPGRAAHPAGQTDRARADDPARNRAAATRGSVRRRRAAQGLVVGRRSAKRASTRPARSLLELDAVVPSGAYRARIAATAGFVAATSPVLQVTA